MIKTKNNNLVRLLKHEGKTTNLKASELVEDAIVYHQDGVKEHEISIVEIKKVMFGKTVKDAIWASFEYLDGIKKGKPDTGFLFNFRKPEESSPG